MFCIKGTNPEKEAIRSILSSVGMKESSSPRDCTILCLLNRYGSLNIHELSSTTTINRLTGSSKELLTEKYAFMKFLKEQKSNAALPALLFHTIHESSVASFMRQGTHYKFLKASDGFAGSGNKVVDSVEEVKKFVESYAPTREFNGWILQDALEETATFQGYKFHLRVMVVVVVRNGKTSIFMSNYHTYVLSTAQYDVKKLKEPDIYNTHKKRNHQNAFFPMERPDTWTIKETEHGMKQIQKELHSIFTVQHSFQPDWKRKNGYELLGVDILFDTKHNPYILEINQKMAVYPSQTIFLPEVLHIGLGGSSMKLFQPLLGTSSSISTPLLPFLTEFYSTKYTTKRQVQVAFQRIFHTTLEEEADRAYIASLRTTRKRRRSLVK